MDAVEKEMGREVVDGAGGANIEQRGGGMESLKEERADDIVRGTDEPFCFAVLGRDVRTRETESDAIRREQLTKTSSEKFTAVVTLQTLHKRMKLSKNKRKETLQGGTCVGFGMERKGPRVVSIIIQNNKIIFVA